jgi:hypothetical protein
MYANATETQTQPAAPPPSQPQALRRYIYCVIDSDAADSFGPLGIEGKSEVFAVPHNGMAAVVSATAQEKLEISRGSAIAHQRVMEAVMQRGHTVLPVRFNTIAESRGEQSAQQRIIDHVLGARRDEILGLFTAMRPCVEMGVKGLWPDVAAVFRDLVECNQDIRAFGKKLLSPSGVTTSVKRPVNMTAQIKLGEMVKKALERRQQDTRGALLARLKPLAKDFRENKTFGDPMFANLALLVEKSRQEDVLAVLTAFEAQQLIPAKIRCIGPLPPCNFLELVISWDD